MIGKVLKISNNDLYGNVDDREVALFATFIHKKYMNRYAIFTFKNEYAKNKLYCGSIHLKENSIVTFSIRNDEVDYINTFVNQLLSGQVDANEYEIIDVSNINKIELVSNTPIDFERLVDLDNLTIPKEQVAIEEVPTKKPAFLYFLLLISILLLGGVVFLHYNPDFFNVELNKLDCTMNGYDKKVELVYISNAEIKFDKRNELISLNKIDTYTFDDLDTYLDFKDNNKESIYFTINGSYKYDDDNLTLKLIYQDETILYKYDEILKYMKKEGYSCIKGVYNEKS